MVYPNFQLPSISVAAVYGTATPTIPAGYEPTGEFRWVKSDEHYISTTQVAVLAGYFTLHEPRIILRIVPKRKVVTFKHTGEFTTIVPKGSWYCFTNPSWSGNYYHAKTDIMYSSAAQCEIVIRTETEV